MHQRAVEGCPKAEWPWPSWMATTLDLSYGPIQATLLSLVGLSVVSEGRTRSEIHIRRSRQPS